MSPPTRLRFPRLEVGRALDRAGEDELAEPRGETLDLCLDARSHVLRRAVRHVAVRPSRVLAGGRARSRRKSDCCTSRTKGRSACRPFHGSDSDAAISSRVPPR